MRIACFLALCAPAILCAPPPGTIIVDASQFFDQIPNGDTIGGGFSNTAWLFNNTAINLVSAEPAVARVSVPEAGAYHLFVRSQGSGGSSFRVEVGGKPSAGVFGDGPLAWKRGDSFDLKPGPIEVRLSAIKPRPMLDVIVLSRNAGFEEKDLHVYERLWTELETSGRQRST